MKDLDLIENNQCFLCRGFFKELEEAKIDGGEKIWVCKHCLEDLQYGI